MTQCANGVDAAVCMLLDGQTSAVHQKQLLAPSPPLSHLLGMPAWVKLIEVDAERHRQHVRHLDSVELRAREGRGAHHCVMVRGGAAVGEIRDGAGHATREYLADKTIQSFMRDHHGGHVVSPAPAAE